MLGLKALTSLSFSMETALLGTWKLPCWERGNYLLFAEVNSRVHCLGKSHE